MTDYQAQVEAFLARGGAVKVVAEGQGMNLSASEWHAKVRDPVVKTVSPMDRPTNEREDWRGFTPGIGGAY